MSALVRVDYSVHSVTKATQRENAPPRESRSLQGHSFGSCRSTHHERRACLSRHFSLPSFLCVCVCSRLLPHASYTTLTWRYPLNIAWIFVAAFLSVVPCQGLIARLFSVSITCGGGCDQYGRLRVVSESCMKSGPTVHPTLTLTAMSYKQGLDWGVGTCGQRQPKIGRTNVSASTEASVYCDTVYIWYIASSFRNLASEFLDPVTKTLLAQLSSSGKHNEERAEGTTAAP